MDDRERRPAFVSLPLPKKLVLRFLDCLPRLIAIDRLLVPMGSEFSFSELMDCDWFEFEFELLPNEEDDDEEET